MKCGIHSYIYYAQTFVHNRNYHVSIVKKSSYHFIKTMPISTVISSFEQKLLQARRQEQHIALNVCGNNLLRDKQIRNNLAFFIEPIAKE